MVPEPRAPGRARNPSCRFNEERPGANAAPSPSMDTRKLKDRTYLAGVREHGAAWALWLPRRARLSAAQSTTRPSQVASRLISRPVP